MTLYGLIASLAWSVVLVWLARKFEPIVRQWLAQRVLLAGDEFRRGTTESEERLERTKLKWEAKLAIAELSLPRSVAHQEKKDIILPDDLEAYVMQWQDQWAQRDERANIRNQYLEMHNGSPEQTWQRVRRAVGVGEMPPTS